jgi:hypothetical protein
MDIDWKRNVTFGALSSLLLNKYDKEDTHNSLGVRENAQVFNDGEGVSLQNFRSATTPLKEHIIT